MPTVLLILVLAQSVDAHSRPAKPVARIAVSGQAETSYSSNVFREQRRRMPTFQDKSDPGERYHQLASPDDFIHGGGLAVQYKRRVGSGRHLKLGASANYFRYTRSPIASHFRIRGDASYEVTKRDRFSLRLNAVPSRFRRNFSARAAAGDKIYDPAFYRQVDADVAYRRRWNSRWESEIEGTWGARRYFGIFGNRDRNWNEFSLFIAHEITKRLELGIKAVGNVTWTPAGQEFGIVVDRSFKQALVIARAHLSLPAHLDVRGEVELRQRRYSTDVVLNDGYYQRQDQRIAIALDASKRIVKGVDLLVEAEWMNNNTDRHDPEVDTGELGYEVLSVGLGVRGTF